MNTISSIHTTITLLPEQHRFKMHRLLYSATRCALLAGLLAVMLGAGGCKKFLDKKSDQQLVVPTTIADFQALLDRTNPMLNGGMEPAIAAADDHYLTNADWAALSTEQARNLYIWAPAFVIPQDGAWYQIYLKLYRSNIVMDNKNKLERNAATAAAWDNLIGSALADRASGYYEVAQVWAPAYDPATAAKDLGIPLRTDPDFNLVSERVSVQATYDQILSDLTSAIPLLPVTPIHTIRPSKPMAYALLARTHLAMRHYVQAGLYADSCLQLKHDLLNFNTLTASAKAPFKQFNAETIFYQGSGYNTSKSKIAPEVLNSFTVNDLRKTCYFGTNTDATISFKGNYTGFTTSAFGGVATDEMYLVRAECFARAGKVSEAMNDLNTLMITRWKTGTFVPFSAAGQNEALQLVLSERRKELLFRGHRWMDIKRLNKDGANITLTRTLNGKTYTLPPNDPRYALALPENVIAISHMPQNPR